MGKHAVVMPHYLETANSCKILTILKDPVIKVYWPRTAKIKLLISILFLGGHTSSRTGDQQKRFSYFKSKINCCLSENVWHLDLAFEV